MAWPYDTKHTTFSAAQKIASTFLNELQDRIIDAHETRYAYACADLEGDWDYGIHVGWLSAGSGWLALTFPLPTLVKVKALEMKYKLATAAGMTWSLRATEMNIDAANTAPAAASVISSGNFTFNSAGQWEVQTVDFADYEVPIDEFLILRIDDSDSGDIFAGARLFYEPLKQ